MSTYSYALHADFEDSLVYITVASGDDRAGTDAEIRRKLVG